MNWSLIVHVLLHVCIFNFVVHKLIVCVFADASSKKNLCMIGIYFFCL